MNVSTYTKTELDREAHAAALNFMREHPDLGGRVGRVSWTLEIHARGTRLNVFFTRPRGRETFEHTIQGIAL